MATPEQLRKDFADDTAYERLVLETIVDPHKAPPGTEYVTEDLRRGPQRIISIGLHDSIGAGAVNAFASKLQPLSFGAAYKILDFLRRGGACARPRLPIVARTRVDQPMRREANARA